jgi:hypothetical protein
VFVNTYVLQRAIRDDATLNAGEVAVLLVLTTYLPHAAPSVDAIAQGCRMMPKSTVYTFNPPLKNPPLEEPGVSQYQGSFEGRHPPLETPPKETRKRQSPTTTISEARERLGEWAEVWDKVIGHGPLPSLEELRRWRPKVTEAHVSACLGEVANARTAGTVNAPRSLFFHRLKNTIGQPTPTAWTKAQVLAALRPATATSAPDLRRPDLQTPDVPPPFTETPEERQARLKVSRAAYEAMSAILKETSKND